MNYSDFIERYNSNQMSVDVDKNKAGFMYEQPSLMPLCWFHFHRKGKE